MALLGFPFTGLKVVVGRPGYRINSRTIKRGSRLGNLITSSQGAQFFAYLHPLFVLLLDVSLCEVLELVASSSTSPSSSKTEIICIFYCVFEFGGFTGSSSKEVHTSPSLVFYLFPYLGITSRYFDIACSKLSKKPKFAKIGVRMKKLPRLSF